MTIDPKDIALPRFMNLMQSAVAPRPIAFVSTIDTEGNVNLSPFSFFNIVSINPPILVFSPARRMRDNTTKHTLQNIEKVQEVVINMVDYAMVQQCSLASTEYAQGIDEFIKSGLAPLPSVCVRPPRVAQSPAAFECVVRNIVPLGTEGGAGNLVFCEVVMAHFAPHIFNENGEISPQKTDLVARLGGNYYARINGENIFEVAKPLSTIGIGIDGLPLHIRHSPTLTGNELGKLGNIESLPTPAQITEIKQQYPTETAAELLGKNKVFEALCLLM